MSQLLFISLATSAIAVTITRGRIFESWRAWLRLHNYYLGELVSCSYCASHWVAMALVALYNVRVIRTIIVEPTIAHKTIDYFVNVFVVVALSSLISGLILKGYEKRD